MTNLVVNTDIVDRFTQAVKASGGTVDIIPFDLKALDKAIEKSVVNDKSVLFAGVDDLPPEWIPIIKKHSTVKAISDGKIIAETYTGITGAFAGVARTGSVCVSIDKSFGAAASLFTRKHICVLDAKIIVERPRDVFDIENSNELNSIRDFVFISGPSATADMGELVRGVHGPGEFHIIVVR